MLICNKKFLQFLTALEVAAPLKRKAENETKIRFLFYNFFFNKGKYFVFYFICYIFKWYLLHKVTVWKNLTELHKLEFKLWIFSEIDEPLDYKETFIYGSVVTVVSINNTRFLWKSLFKK